MYNGIHEFTYKYITGKFSKAFRVLLSSLWDALWSDGGGTGLDEAVYLWAVRLDPD